MYTLYILFSFHLNKYYVGFTDDLPERLRRHLSDHDGFTSRAKDWKVVHTESFEVKSAAAKREKEIKSWKSSNRIRKLIEARG